MTKRELIKKIKKQCRLTTTEAAEVVDTIFGEMTDALVNQDRIEIRGMFSLHVKEYKSYVGRNPQTGKYVKIPEKRLPFFKCGKDLKERVNS